MRLIEGLLVGRYVYVVHLYVYHHQKYGGHARNTVQCVRRRVQHIQTKAISDRNT